jgi:hypothetical protein
LGTAIGGVVADSYSPFAVVMVSAALALAAASTPLIARTAGPVSGLSREPAKATSQRRAGAERPGISTKV